MAEEYYPLSPYAYCGNNPVMYRDYNGEWFGLDDLIVAAVGFAINYVSHGISTGHWGASALQAGAMGAIGAWVGFNTFGAGMGLGDYLGNMAFSAGINAVIPPVNIPIGNFNFSISPGIGFGADGLVGGMNFGVTYTAGDWALSAGYGVSSAGNTLSGGLSYYDRKNGQSFSFYMTDYHGGKDPQTVGGIGFSKGDFSLRVENDMFAFSGQDRYRTSAVELGIGNYVIGTNIYTNDPKNETVDGVTGAFDENGVNLSGKKNKHGYGSWTNGIVYRAPAYIGYKSGYRVTKVGYSSRYIQDRTQNWVHRNLPGGYQHYYNKYGTNIEGWYNHSGYYNPFSLW
jgi:hypothetical protein